MSEHPTSFKVTLPLKTWIEVSRLRNELLTQDNLATAHPIFIVQGHRRLYGYDTDYAEHIAWIDDCNDGNEADEEEARELEEQWEASGEEPEGWTRTGYVEQWEYIQPFLSAKEAEAFIAGNQHRFNHYTDLRVYADSAYRNPEMQLLRRILMEGDIRPMGPEWGRNISPAGK